MPARGFRSVKIKKYTKNRRSDKQSKLVACEDLRQICFSTCRVGEDWTTGDDALTDSDSQLNPDSHIHRRRSSNIRAVTLVRQEQQQKEHVIHRIRDKSNVEEVSLFFFKRIRQFIIFWDPSATSTHLPTSPSLLLFHPFQIPSQSQPYNPKSEPPHSRPTSSPLTQLQDGNLVDEEL
ncbi:hypothetical protein FB446DRAFT_708155 [Lentinula raphanica]|nr:hypothetical protein FB446DRAFT_708155 [Lentinula raphanica]